MNWQISLAKSKRRPLLLLQIASRKPHAKPNLSTKFLIFGVSIRINAQKDGLFCQQDVLRYIKIEPSLSKSGSSITVQEASFGDSRDFCTL